MTRYTLTQDSLLPTNYWLQIDFNREWVRRIKWLPVPTRSWDRRSQRWRINEPWVPELRRILDGEEISNEERLRWYLQTNDPRRHVPPGEWPQWKGFLRYQRYRAKAAEPVQTPGCAGARKEPAGPLPETVDPQDPAWQLLGLQPTTDTKLITNVYRHQARRCHPDGGGSAEQLARLNEAYDRLIRPHLLRRSCRRPAVRCR